MCAIMNKFKVINAAARHRLVLDLRMWWIGFSEDDGTRTAEGANIRR